MRTGAPTGRRITADLREAGWQVSENTVAAIMSGAGAGGQAEEEAGGTRPAGEGALAGAGPGQARLPARQLNRKWYGDGTEIRTG